MADTRTWSDSNSALLVALALALAGLPGPAGAQESGGKPANQSSATTAAEPGTGEVEAGLIGEEPPPHQGAMSSKAQSSVSAGVKIPFGKTKPKGKKGMPSSVRKEPRQGGSP